MMASSSLRSTASVTYRRAISSIMERSADKVIGHGGRGQGGRYPSRRDTPERRMMTTTKSSGNSGAIVAKNSGSTTWQEGDGLRSQFHQKHGLKEDTSKKSNNQMHSNKKYPSKKNNPTVDITTDQFISNFHDKIRAAKYKVHAPNCDCVKIDKIRNRYLHSRQKATQYQSVPNNNTTTPTPAYGADVQFDIDGGFTRQFGNLHVNDSVFDNLIVIPDTARPSSAYICKDTNSTLFRQDGIACEQKLAMEIFGSKSGDARASNVSSFKVSCAICLLTGHFRNGFVALVSPSANELQSIVQTARVAAEAKRESGFHPDHAQFVCTLEVSTLQSLLRAKTRAASFQWIKQILTQMNDSGVDLSDDTQAIVHGHDQQSPEAKIELGHHLESLLCIILADKSKMKQYKHIMVIGYHHDTLQWTLDLPGGKRHLGETTLQGAIREVEEECSLRLNSECMYGQVSVKYGGSVGNGANGSVTVVENSGDAFMLVCPSVELCTK